MPFKRSLSRYAIGIPSIGTLLSSDIIRLTELVPNHENAKIDNSASNFSVIFNSSEKNFIILAF